MADRLAEVEVSGGRFRFPAEVQVAYPHLRGLFQIPTGTGTAGALVPAAAGELVEETVEVAAPRITSMAQGNALLSELGQGWRFLIDQGSDLARLLDYSESAAGLAEDVAARAARAAEVARQLVEANAIDVVPEVVVAGSRLGNVARILTGTPLGLSTLIVEGLYDVGTYLSGQALEDAIRRITPPPVAPVDLATPDPEPDPSRPDYFDPTPVTVSAPRPLSDPLTSNPLLYQPFPTPTGFGFSLPTPVAVPNPLLDPSPLASPSPQPIPTDLTLADPLSWPSPSPSPSPSPRDFLISDPLSFSDPVLTGLNPGGVGSPPTSAPPSSTSDPCRCGPQQKKKKKKKSPRTVCYSGTYRERTKSLSKARKRKIPCR